MIWGIGEIFCTPGGAQVGAQGADLGGSKGANYSSEFGFFLVPILKAGKGLQCNHIFGQILLLIVLSCHFLPFLTHQDAIKLNYSIKKVRNLALEMCFWSVILSFNSTTRPILLVKIHFKSFK